MRNRTDVGRIWANLARWFPERQIYHRAEGRVSYLTIPTQVQVAGVAVAVGVAGWLMFTSVNYALSERRDEVRTLASQAKLFRYEQLLQEARSREASALALLETRTEEFREVAANFEARHNALSRLIGAAGDAISSGGTGQDERLVMSGVAPSLSSSALRSVALRGDGGEGSPTMKLGALEADQERMIAVAEAAAAERITAAREAIAMVGLNIEDLSAGNVGMGGPLVQLDLSAIAPDLEMDEAFNERLEAMADTLAEADELDRVIRAAPFGSPVGAEYRVNSRFGGRVDPFTHSGGYHTGLDMGAYHRAPVVASAEGTISFAGWKGGYGRTVEIDHGNGFKTRYAHLSLINVEVGDTVSLGEKVGAMGSTGRSTGTHLHYEVWFRGKVQDPSKYLKAGNYVQQG